MNKSEIIKKFDYIATSKHLTIVRDIFKYGFVSVFALAVDVGLLYVLVEFAGMLHIAAATVAFTGGLVVNYSLARLFVFKNSKHPLRQEFIWYATIGVIGLVLNDLIIYLLVWMQLWYLYAKAISVAVVFFFNFFGRRRLFTDQ